jgi:hypothetical protein
VTWPASKAWTWGELQLKRRNFRNIKTSALTKRWGLRYTAYIHSLCLKMLIYLGPDKNGKFQILSKLWKKQWKRAARLHARACTHGWNLNSQEVSVGPWQHFSFWQLVSSFKTVAGRAWNVKCVLDWSDRFVWRGGEAVGEHLQKVAPFLNRSLRLGKGDFCFSSCLTPGEAPATKALWPGTLSISARNVPLRLGSTGHCWHRKHA